MEHSLGRLDQCEPGSDDYEVFRNAVIKGVELTLETSGKLLRKVLRDYVANPKTFNDLVFKDLFRQAAHYNLMTMAEVERWFSYRDSRNDTAHDYGIEFAETVLTLIKEFLLDARRLPFSVDLLDWAKTPEQFLTEIKRNYYLLQEGGHGHKVNTYF